MENPKLAGKLATEHDRLSFGAVSPRESPDARARDSNASVFEREIAFGVAGSKRAQRAELFLCRPATVTVLDSVTGTVASSVGVSEQRDQLSDRSPAERGTLLAALFPGSKYT